MEGKSVIAGKACPLMSRKDDLAPCLGNACAWYGHNKCVLQQLSKQLVATNDHLKILNKRRTSG